MTDETRQVDSQESEREAASPPPREAAFSWQRGAGVVLAAGAFLLLFWPTLEHLVRDWLTLDDYRHGLLLAPLAAYLAWNRRVSERVPDRRLGLLALVAAVLLFWAATAAAEYFTMRFSVLVALAGLTLFYLGREQLRAWWLPFALLAFTIPLPQVVLNTLTLPLQLLASEAAVELLEFRRVPVLLAGNVIRLPGQELFVAEACSGLRSVSALFGLTLLFGGTGLGLASSRLVLLALALPAAIATNILRVFATGFLGYHFGPAATEGAMHETTGILVFVAALGIVVAAMGGLRVWERRRERRGEEGSP